MSIVVKIKVGEEAYQKMTETVAILRQNPIKDQQTSSIVTNLATVTAHFNQGYFIDTVERLKINPARIRTKKKAVGIAVHIQSRMLSSAFSRFSPDQLSDIANMMEVREPVKCDDGYYILVPLEASNKQLANKMIKQIREQEPKSECVESLTQLAKAMLRTIIEFNFIEPLQAMEVNTYFMTLVSWATTIWLAMNAREVRRLGNDLTEAQLQIYADIIEAQVSDDDI